MIKELGIKRNPTQQDLSWFLDLYAWNQIDLNPPYQRKSIWGRSDKKFFLNTIFNNFPCPAIYVQKEIKNGKTMYFVVDGKQRLQTIFDFYNNKLSIPSDFGDLRLDGKKWKDIEKDSELSSIFYDYNFTVEILTGVQNELWKEVFDRLNRNAKVLTDQELRHARFDGWLINNVENEANEENLENDNKFWKNVGIATKGKAARMKDAEFISILMLIILENDFVGFPQDAISELYLKYDKIIQDGEDPEIGDFVFSQDMAQNALNRFSTIKSFLVSIEKETQLLSSTFFKKKNTTHLYSLWAYFALNNIYEIDGNLINKIKMFYEMLETVSGTDSTMYSSLIGQNELYQCVIKYYENCSGASTEIPPRKDRHDALTEFISRV